MATDQNNTSAVTAYVLRDTLIKDFMQGAFLPGSKMNIDELAERYSVSRTPIREALLLLVQEDILASTGNYGFKVRIPSLEELCEMQEVRCALESLAIEKVITSGNTAELLRQLEDNQRMMLQTENDLALKKRLDRKFHELIYSHCESTTLAKIVRRCLVLSIIFNYTELYVPEAFLSTHASHRSLCKQHQRIIDGIASGNVKKARKAIELHIIDARNNLEEQNSGKS